MQNQHFRSRRDQNRPLTERAVLWVVWEGECPPEVSHDRGEQTPETPFSESHTCALPALGGEAGGMVAMRGKAPSRDHPPPHSRSVTSCCSLGKSLTPVAPQCPRDKTRVMTIE